MLICAIYLQRPRGLKQLQGEPLLYMDCILAFVNLRTFVQMSWVGFAIDLELLSVLFLDYAYDFPAFCPKIVNLTGFRKALTKYEKITKISVMDVYMKEKVCSHLDELCCNTQVLSSCR